MRILRTGDGYLSSFPCVCVFVCLCVFLYLNMLSTKILILLVSEDLLVN